VSTVLYLFALRPGADPSEYEAWAASVDLPTLRSLRSVRSYRILRTRRSDIPAAVTAAYIEILDVTSADDFHRDMAAPALAEVAATFTRFASTPTLLVGDDLLAAQPTQRTANSRIVTPPG